MQYQNSQCCYNAEPNCFTGCGQTMPIVPGTNPALQTWNGQNFVVADGSAQNQITLPYIQINSGTPQYILGVNNIGTWSYYPYAIPDPSSGSFTTLQCVGSTTAGNPLTRITQTGAGYALLVEDDTNPDATPFVVHASGAVSVGNTTDAGASNLFVSGNLAGSIVTALSSLTGSVVKASGSAGLTLQNASGTAQMQIGLGGGSNISLEVATNIKPANADVDISPTGTGKVTINPASTGSINNMVVGSVTPLAVNATNLTASSSFVTNGAPVEIKGLTSGKTLSIAGAGGAGDPVLTISVNDAADAFVVVPSVIGGGNSALIIDVGDATISSWTFAGGDLFPSQGAKNMTNGFIFIPGSADAPTGTPTTTNAGVFPMYVNSTPGSERLYVYVNGAWKSTNLT